MASEINLDSGILCREAIKSSSKYVSIASRKCHCLKGHSGKCVEFPFILSLKAKYPKVSGKIIRDSIMTTGAAWKSEEAGPNRILRWVMLESDDKLAEFGINMANLQSQVVTKLREKAADYDSCIRVAMWLTYSVYQMSDAPDAPKSIKAYLESFLGPMNLGSTVCTVCQLPLSFNLFEEARRGKAAIETCHKDPRIHSPNNVGFAHRECNIAQGARTLSEFYDWIGDILSRARPK